jgi:hypothetical protein
MFKYIKTLFANRAMFNKTYNELSNLSDFELNDIGLSRGEIYTVAMEAQQMADAKAGVEFKPTTRTLLEVHP